jgi:hypothetical protein
MPPVRRRESDMGVLLKPISDRLLWIEAALFLHQDQRDDRLRWFVPELLLQIKNARLDR